MKFNPRVFTNRTAFVVLLMVVFASCKTTQTGTSTGEHYEDLSYLREEVAVVDQEIIQENQPLIEEEAYIPEPSMDITTEVADYSGTLAERRKAQGYTRYYIQVYSGNNRAKATQASSEVRTKFPSFRPDTAYDQPNFKVRIGSFLEKLEAWPAYKAVKAQFPTAVLVSERIRP